MRVEGCLVTVNGHDQRYFSAAATSALVTTDDGAAGFASPMAGKVEATDGSTATVGCIDESSAKVAPSSSQPLLLNVRNRLPSVEQASRLAEIYYIHIAPVRPQTYACYVKTLKLRCTRVVDIDLRVRTTADLQRILAVGIHYGCRQ